MCDMGISESTMAYMAIASAVASTAAAQYTANKQTSALKTQAQARSDQITIAGSAQLGVRARQARIDAGKAEVAGGESGVQGQSYEAGINNISQGQKMDSGNIEQNTLNQQKSNTQDTLAVASRITQPNYLGAALQIGNAGMGLSGGTGSNLGTTSSILNMNGGAGLGGNGMGGGLGNFAI